MYIIMQKKILTMILIILFSSSVFAFTNVRLYDVTQINIPPSLDLLCKYSPILELSRPFYTIKEGGNLEITMSFTDGNYNKYDNYDLIFEYQTNAGFVMADNLEWFNGYEFINDKIKVSFDANNFYEIVEHPNLEKGFRFRVKVKDKYNCSSDWEYFFLNVKDVNRLPVLQNFYMLTTCPKVNENIPVGIFAKDLDGDKLSYSWLINGKQVLFSSTGLIAFSEFGKNKLKIIIDDGYGVSFFETEIYVKNN